MNIAVIGGGEAGDFYVRQLLRAARAGRLDAGRLLVVDRDPACRAAERVTGPGSRPAVELAVAEWEAWLDGHLLSLAPGDQLVPYHWAPHLLFGWLAREAERAGAFAARVPGGVPERGLPFERETRDGDRALSYADWLCPPTCIEPELCPHTRGPKAWSLAADLAQAPGLDGALQLPSLHFAYGVATIPVASVQAARERILAAARANGGRFLVSTASHCHGLAAVLEVRPASAPALA